MGLGYHDKGWPSFEYRLAMMIKVSNDSFHSDWPQVLDLGKKNLFDAQWKNLTRAAPAEPLAFFEGHEYGEKRYTYATDRDQIVAPKCAPSPSLSASCALPERVATPLCCVCRFRETTFELFGGVTELNFSKLKWGDTEAAQLAVVLPLCAKLTTLSMLGNQVGDKGAAALAGAIKSNSALTELYLNGNSIGDAGAAAIADALRVNGVLRRLYLYQNSIRDTGAAVLVEALRSNGALTKLDLMYNEIKEDCKSALREAVQGRSGFNLSL